MGWGFSYLQEPRNFPIEEAVPTPKVHLKDFRNDIFFLMSPVACELKLAVRSLGTSVGIDPYKKADVVSADDLLCPENTTRPVLCSELCQRSA